MIKGIGHAAMRAADIEATAAFYREVLGFQEAFRMNNEDGTLGTIYMYVASGQFIELFSGGIKPVECDGETIGHCHMCYLVGNAEEALQEIKKKGIRPDREITIGKSGCKQFWLRDPDGNRIELMEILPQSLQAQADRRLGEVLKA